MPELAIRSILDIAGRHPQRLALACHDDQLSYAKLLECARRIAALIGSRADPGSRIAVVAADDTMTYASLLGCWLAGCAYIPLNKDNPAARNEEILRDADARVVLTSQAWAAASDAAKSAGVPCLPTAVESLPVAGERVRDVQPQDTAYMLFTSGSTGKPKGVPITHANLAAFFASWDADPVYAPSVEDRYLQMFELSFDLSVMCYFGALRSGASCHVVPHKGIAYLNIVRVLQAERITVSVMVPSVLAYLERFLGELSLPDLRFSMFAGEALLHGLTERWAPCVPNAVIQNAYGPTEATILTHIYDWDRERSAVESENGIVPIGFPMAGNDGLVLGEHGEEVPADGEGELCLLGPQLTSGYWRNPEKNAQAFGYIELDGRRQRFYRTGDLVTATAAGLVKWRMRKDFQVKIDGHRIELGDIEAHTRQFTGASLVAALARTGSDGRPALALFLQGGEREEDELRSHLAEVLPSYMQPRLIRRLANMPLTSAGKIDRPCLLRQMDE